MRSQIARLRSDRFEDLRAHSRFMAPSALILIGNEIGEGLARFRGERDEGPRRGQEGLRPRRIPLIGNRLPTAGLMAEHARFHQPHASPRKARLRRGQGRRRGGLHRAPRPLGIGKGFGDDRPHGKGKGFIVRDDRGRAPLRQGDRPIFPGVIAKERMGQGVGKARHGPERVLFGGEHGELRQALGPGAVPHRRRWPAAEQQGGHHHEPRPGH